MFILIFPKTEIVRSASGPKLHLQRDTPSHSLPGKKEFPGLETASCIISEITPGAIKIQLNLAAMDLKGPTRFIQYRRIFAIAITRNEERFYQGTEKLKENVPHS